MRFTILLFAFTLIYCSKNEYSSPYGYDNIRMYEYNKKPWDNDAMYNKIYNSSNLSNDDKKLYYQIEKLNFNLKESFKSNLKVDSVFFKTKYREYRHKPNCPAGYNRILLLFKKSELKYAVKFSEYCDQCFLINFTTNKIHFLKIGYKDFLKLTKK